MPFPTPGNGLRALLEFGNVTTIAFIIAFCAVAVVNALEVHVLIWLNFRKYQGLYFWSMMAAVWGVTILTAGILVDIVRVPDVTTAAYLAILFQPGWWAMVTGQSLVLYSRLHLVLDDPRRRYVLYLILFDAVVFHSSTTVCGVAASISGSRAWGKAANHMENTNVTVFFVQETIISALYIWQCRKLLLSSCGAQEEAVFRRVLRDLIWINAFIISTNSTVIATSYASLIPLEQSLKVAVYAYKLRLEFIILNQLTSLVRPGCQSLNVIEIGTARQNDGIGNAPKHSFNHSQRVFYYENHSDQIKIANENPAGLVMKEDGIPISTRFIVREKDKDSIGDEEAILRISSSAA